MPVRPLSETCFSRICLGFSKSVTICAMFWNGSAKGLRYSFLAITAAIVTLSAQPARYDVLIRNGRVLDGSGNPWIALDIGIRGGRIVDMGRLGNAAAERTIDAQGLTVTPGFID